MLALGSKTSGIYWRKFKCFFAISPEKHIHSSYCLKSHSLLRAIPDCGYIFLPICSATDGAKRVSLNEKERGFPQGLRVMSESDGHGSPILHIPSTFDSVQIREGQSYTLTAVEVKTATMSTS